MHTYTPKEPLNSPLAGDADLFILVGLSSHLLARLTPDKVYYGIVLKMIGDFRHALQTSRSFIPRMEITSHYSWISIFVISRPYFPGPIIQAIAQTSAGTRRDSIVSRRRESLTEA